jgi:outer membrane receptor for ferrienterochelin and colicins
MKNHLAFVVIILFAGADLFAQNQLRAILKDSLTNETLPGATIVLKGTANGTSANAEGKITLNNIPDGTQTFSVRMVGYRETEVNFTFPKADEEEIILLVADNQLEEIIIEGTRSNRSIGNIPTRVEVLTEEIDEASTMDPSKVAHLLTHSTGIQVQQTSATSNTANVRIQGLDGRYAQILRDGFPVYGGFSGSLSVMQIPPLDLRQVEYVKGSASTLYGAGAISGLINLISKEPKAGQDETILHLNASHIGAFDVNAFTSARRGKFGYTLLAQRNTHRYFDADNDGFSDMPELTKYNLNPKFFLYFNDKTKMYVGATFTSETRQGGDVKLFGYGLPDSLHFYKEINTISRITTQLKFDRRFNEVSSVTFRNSFNIFKRQLLITPSLTSGDYRFSGYQLSSFTEFAFTRRKGQNVFITGLNFYSDDFNEERLQSNVLRNEFLQTFGYFANYTFDVGKRVAVESGIRTDYTVGYKWHVLPRVSFLFKWTEKLSTRIGGGLGYRNASIFNQEAELLGYRNVMPIDYDKTHAETSSGANADIGFKTQFGENYFFNFNQMFFFTRLDKPIVLQDTSGSSGVYEFVNANGFAESYGAETFFKFGFYDFVLFAGYTYTHATNHFSDTVGFITLTPHHSLKGDLLYALPGKWRIGADYEYKSAQKLSNGTDSPDFWTFGFVIEYTWTNFTFFGNVENYTDVRQTKYESLISGTYGTPQFTDVWAPLDGIVFNAGLKIRL